MYKIICFLLLLATGCTKHSPETASSDRQQHTEDTAGYLTISAATAPASASLEGSIVANVHCTGPNLCYRFQAFEIKETAAREFEIRAKGKVPGQGNICAQAIYGIDTTVSIKPTMLGQYTLRFYNGATLFKTITVLVN